MNKAGLILLVVVSAVLCACAAPQKKVQSPLLPRLVGTVAFVNPTGGFVLIDVGTLYVPVAGKALKCYSGGQETAELTATPERKIPYISADIVKGTPSQGDQVFE